MKKVLAEINKLEQRLAANGVWFQKSKEPEITAVVNRVGDGAGNERFQWNIYAYKEFGPYTDQRLVMRGYKPTLSEAKDEVLDVFDDPSQLKKLTTAKAISRLAADYQEYKREHPNTKKTPSDPAFQHKPQMHTAPKPAAPKPAAPKKPSLMDHVNNFFDKHINPHLDSGDLSNEDMMMMSPEEIQAHIKQHSSKK